MLLLNFLQRMGYEEKEKKKLFLCRFNWLSKLQVHLTCQGAFVCVTYVCKCLIISLSMRVSDNNMCVCVCVHVSWALFMFGNC